MDDADVVRNTFLEDPGAPSEQLLTFFDYAAMASASIGQVHATMLRSGEEVVVKVQHRGIESQIRDDLQILARSALPADRPSRELRLYRPRALVASFRRILLRELDFRLEARNLENFHHQLGADPDVIFPRPHQQLTSQRILTMERIFGRSVRSTSRELR